MAEKECISRAEFGKRNNISRQSVDKWVNSGKFPLKNGKIIMPDAQYIYDEIKRNNTQAVTASTEKAIGVSTNLTQAKTALQTYAAKIKKLEFEKMQGNLISVDEVIKEIEAVAVVMRTELFSIPAKVAPECEGKSISQIELIIHNAINEAFCLLNDFDYYQFNPAGEGLG